MNNNYLMIKGRKAEGEGLILFLIFLLLIPMCSHAKDNAYTSCVDDCKDIKFNQSVDGNWSNHYYINNEEVSEDYVKNYCYIQCKPYYNNNTN